MQAEGLSPTQKLKPVPKKGVEMRVPTTIEISLPDTVGPSSGDEAVTCSGPGRFCTGVPAQGMLALTLHHYFWLNSQPQSTPLRARVRRRGTFLDITYPEALYKPLKRRAVLD